MFGSECGMMYSYHTVRTRSVYRMLCMYGLRRIQIAAHSHGFYKTKYTISAWVCKANVIFRGGIG